MLGRLWWFVDCRVLLGRQHIHKLAEHTLGSSARGGTLCCLHEQDLACCWSAQLYVPLHVCTSLSSKTAHVLLSCCIPTPAKHPSNNHPSPQQQHARRTNSSLSVNRSKQQQQRRQRQQRQRQQMEAAAVSRGHGSLLACRHGGSRTRREEAVWTQRHTAGGCCRVVWCVVRFCMVWHVSGSLGWSFGMPSRGLTYAHKRGGVDAEALQQVGVGRAVWCLVRFCVV